MEIKTEWIYEKIRQIGIGEGRNSEVFLVKDPQRGKEIIVKEIPKSSFGMPDKFFAEAQAMAAAEAPNVVPLYCACQTPDNICVAMPFYSKGSLGKRIANDPIPIVDLIKIGQEVLTGLGCIHSNDLVHFDVKPSNILFDDYGVAMVADFGQSRTLSAGGTASAPPIYNMAFPPEVYTANSGVTQSDIYQMGLTLYRAINGDPFFRAQCPAPGTIHIQTRAGKFPDREYFMPHVPKSLRTVIRKALMVDPAQRYSSASQLQAALARLKVKHNWEVKNTPTKVEWTSRKKGQSILQVACDATGPNDLNISILKAANGNVRAYMKSRWRANLDEKNAMATLKTLFEDLER